MVRVPRAVRMKKKRAEDLWLSIVRAHPSHKPRRMGHPQVHLLGGFVERKNKGVGLWDIRRSLNIRRIMSGLK